MELGSIRSSTLSLLVLITTLLFHFSSASSTKFILNSCKPTTYPTLCMDSLAAYAPFIHRSPRQLADAALTISASRARETSTYVSRLSSGMIGRKSTAQMQAPSVNALHDCIVTMSDSAVRLRRSIHQLRRLGRVGKPSFMLRLSNVQTWVSAALTDQNMCLASLMEGIGTNKVPVVIRKKVVEVSRVTSNALSLVNRLGPRN